LIIPSLSKTTSFVVWEPGWDKIRTEYETHGPTSVPSLVESGVDPETKLAAILLSDDRIKALNEVGFTWSRTPPNASTGPSSITIIRDRRTKKQLETLILGATDGTGDTTANVSIVDYAKRINKDAIRDEMYERLLSSRSHCIEASESDYDQ